MKTITFEQVERKRRDFAKALKTFRQEKGRFHNPAPELPAEKVAGCELLPNLLMLLDKLPKGQVMGAVGLGDGRFAMSLLDHCQPSSLHLFKKDLSELTSPQVYGELASENCRIKPQVGDLEKALGRLPNAFFDAVYINGDHAFEVVSRTIELLEPKMKPGGAMIFHSYATWSAVTMYHCGVARAVHEFCLSRPWKFRYLALEAMMYNDVMLVRDDQI